MISLVLPGVVDVLASFFDFGEFMLADLPGYGFAKVSKEEKKKWGALLESFLSTQKICLLLSLVDIRHDPTADDKMMINYLYHYAVPFALVATKADKLNKTEREKAMNRILDMVDGVDVIPFSSQTGEGKEQVWERIFKAID